MVQPLVAHTAVVGVALHARERIHAFENLARPGVGPALDELFSSLDEKTAQALRREIRRFQQQIGINTLLVTHNLQEAAYLGHRIAEIRRGELMRSGTQRMDDTGTDLTLQ